MLIVLLMIGLVCIFLPKFNTLRKHQRRKDENTAENRQLQLDTNELRTKQERFNSDPAVVERTARNIGMVRPDEVVFKFTNRQSSANGDIR